MNCINCGCESPHIFCKEHTPSYGENVRIKTLSIYVGEIRFFLALLDFLRRKSVIRWWIGTDVLLLYKFPPGRGKISTIFHRIKSFILGHIVLNWTNSIRLKEELESIRWMRYKNGIIHRVWPGKYGKYGKINHTGFNIAYYHPRNDTYSRWVYGIDIIEKLKLFFPVLNWIKLDGKMKMDEIYPFLDLYIRPSRHDGFPRTILECVENEIPFLWSENGAPDMEWFIREIKIRL